MKSKSEKALLEGEIALKKAAMTTVRTLLEGERLGYNNASTEPVPLLKLLAFAFDTTVNVLEL